MNGLRIAQGADGTADIELSGGGMAVGETTEQNQWLLLTTHAGEWKEHPTVGVGIGDMANDHDLEWWKREIAEALEADGQTVEKIEIKTDRLTIKARYRQ